MTEMTETVKTWGWAFDEESERGVRVKLGKKLRYLREEYPALDLHWKFDFGSDVQLVKDSTEWNERARLSCQLGFPDLLVWCKDADGARRKLAIELKREGFYCESGHLGEQTEWQKVLKGYGYEPYFAAGYDAACQLIWNKLGISRLRRKNEAKEPS